ncbi:hypothetical protein SD457_12935 [Coprobacillaceae bacterium CR2/5/TPMF4]|nr:hypothetical protein SD457_12935 [Coprobacillaceae bacterium CR2/5/TPMF4]
MTDYIDRPVGKYSRGMKQKVSLARSIVHRPDVMLLMNQLPVLMYYLVN